MKFKFFSQLSFGDLKNGTASRRDTGVNESPSALPAEYVERSTPIRGREFRWLEPCEVEGVSTRERRAKPLLVFLHGFPDTAGIWREWFTQFRAEYEILAPQLPLAQEVKFERFRMESLVQDYMEFLAPELATGRPLYVVAHDVGGALAMRLAEALGPRLTSLILINGLSLEQFKKRLKNPKQVAKSWYMAAMQLPVLAPVVFHHQPRRFQIFLKRFFETSLDVGREGRTYPVYRAWLQDLFLNPRAVRPAPIQVPILVLWSESDPFLMPPTWDEFSEVATQFTIRILRGSHWAHIENVAEAATHVRGFLASAPSPTAAPAMGHAVSA